MKFVLSGFLLICAVLSASGQADTDRQYLNLDQVITLEAAVDINTKFLEFAPAYYGEGLVFVFARDQSKFIDKVIGLPYFELMYAPLNPQGLPSKSTNFSSNIRTNFHEGPTCFSLGEEVVYFTRSNIRRGKAVPDSTTKRSVMKIYRAVKGPDDWEEIAELPFCSDNYTVMHPSVTPDDQTIFFTSDMPGGYGGFDLYMSSRNNGEWENPVNLGPEVNSPANESFPFLHPRGVLFFSSEGHDGLGGIDLYAVLQQGEHFVSVINLGAPFNSSKDDLSLVVDPDGLSGFFASSRKEAKGRDDIYQFSVGESIFNFQPVLAEGMLEVADAFEKPLAGATAWIFELKGETPDYPDGFYSTGLEPAEADQNALVLAKTRNPEFPPQFRSNDQGAVLFKIDPAKEYAIVVGAAGYDDHLHQLNGMDILTNPVLRITMQPLSPASDCIVLSGEVRDRATNEPIDALVTMHNSCSDLSRAQETEIDGQFSICVEPDCVHRTTISAEGYALLELDVDPSNAPSSQTILLDKLGSEIVSVQGSAETKTDDPEVLEAGDVILLENIYYDFNKSEIRKGSEDDLASLAEIMRSYPSMQVELSSHTDSRGRKEYNLELSERRALSALQFLTERGIRRSRIKMKPMGEAEPRNRCVDGVQCSEEEHQFNRRTEIKVLKIDEQIRIRYGSKRPDGS